jgi:NADP-dependent 3-hydroxy acid dehydrogenase YdfG
VQCFRQRAVRAPRQHTRAWPPAPPTRSPRQANEGAPQWMHASPPSSGTSATPRRRGSGALTPTPNSSPKRLVGRAVEEFGRLDVLVNNAGISKIGPISGIDIDGWSARINVYLCGVPHGIAAALPVFQRQGEGHLVTTVSTAGLKIVPNQAVYAATKTPSVPFWKDCGRSRLTGWCGPRQFHQGSSAPSSTARSMPRRSRADPAQHGRIRPSAGSRRAAVAFAVEQPRDVEIGDITICPTAQG